MNDRQDALTASPDRPGSPAPAPSKSGQLADELFELTKMDLEQLIATYELEVLCHHCKAVHKRAIGWLQADSTMECPNCRESIVLRTSLMNDEMRRVARQLRKLREQLTLMIERATARLAN